MKYRPNPILLTLLVLAVIALLLYPLVAWQKAEERAADLEQQVAELTLQNRGPQGPDGEPGRAPTEDEILQAVTAYCSSSGSCVGPAGATGSTGQSGPQGSPGVSVGSVKCNGTSITFYSTTGQSLGSIRMVCIP